MLIDRLVIAADAGSPMRVSASGASAAVAQFNDLIFDANQPPLRLWGTGWQQLIGVSFNEFAGGKNTNEGSPTVVAGSPDGTTPIFMVMAIGAPGGGIQISRPPNRANSGSGGGGGSICRSGGINYFIPLTFGSVGPPSTPDVQGVGALVNYAICRNWT